MVLPPAPVINASGEKVPGRGPQKVTTRWRPGKAPEWAPEAKAEGFASGGSARASRLVEEPAILSEVGALTHDATDRRLRRLAEVRASGRQRDVADAEILEPGDEDEDDDRHARRARREEEEEQEDEEQEQENAASDEDESEDEDKLEARRARVREMAKRRLADKGDQELMGEEEEDEEKAKGESSDSWEYETDSEEEDNMRLIKPVFVSKAARGTLEERERIEKEEAEEEKMKQLRLEQRKKDTRKLVAEELQKEKQAMVDRQMRQKREDTDEEGNEEEEYDKWRLRELKRIKRDREARDRFEREKSDTDRRRTMTGLPRPCALLTLLPHPSSFLGPLSLSLSLARARALPASRCYPRGWWTGCVCKRLGDCGRSSSCGRRDREQRGYSNPKLLHAAAPSSARGLACGMQRLFSLLNMTPGMRHAKAVRAFIQTELSSSKCGAHRVRAWQRACGVGYVPLYVPLYVPCTCCERGSDGLSLAWTAVACRLCRARPMTCMYPPPQDGSCMPSMHAQCMYPPPRRQLHAIYAVHAQCMYPPPRRQMHAVYAVHAQCMYPPPRRQLHAVNAVHAQCTHVHAVHPNACKTDAQIMAENASSGKATKSKAAMVFMQKYHHKGAFFMENDESNRVRPQPKPCPHVLVPLRS